MSRYAPIDEVLRSLVTTDIAKYNEWKKQQQNVTDNYKILDAIPDKIDVTIPKQQLEYTLGTDKATTEEWIVKKYNLKEGRVTTALPKPSQKKPSVCIIHILF